MEKTERTNPELSSSSKPCAAKNRDGSFCRVIGMANGRCRVHGGVSTGPRTSEGLARSKRSNYKHGYYSVEAIAEQRHNYRRMQELRHGLKQVDTGFSTK
jgi:hypothetical protein